MQKYVDMFFILKGNNKVHRSTIPGRIQKEPYVDPNFDFQ